MVVFLVFIHSLFVRALLDDSLAPGLAAQLLIVLNHSVLTGGKEEEKKKKSQPDTNTCALGLEMTVSWQEDRENMAVSPVKFQSETKQHADAGSETGYQEER